MRIEITLLFFVYIGMLIVIMFTFKIELPILFDTQKRASFIFTYVFELCCIKSCIKSATSKQVEEDFVLVLFPFWKLIESIFVHMKYLLEFFM